MSEVRPDTRTAQAGAPAAGRRAPGIGARQGGPAPRRDRAPALVEPVRIWDLPTRLFHWSLAVCVAGSLASIQVGGLAVGWHFRFGYAILTLLLFRLAWGFVGPRYARFASFPPSPAAAWRYLRGSQAHGVGHSPLGALSVYALLLSLGFQVCTGLFANDAIMWDGPLRALVSNATSDLLTSLHKINRVLLIGLVLLHLVAIAWYSAIKRQRLLVPMISGDRMLPVEMAGRVLARDGVRERLLALVLLAGSAAIVWFVVNRLA